MSSLRASLFSVLALCAAAGFAAACAAAAENQDLPQTPAQPGEPTETLILRKTRLANGSATLEPKTTPVRAAIPSPVAPGLRYLALGDRVATLALSADPQFDPMAALGGIRVWEKPQAVYDSRAQTYHDTYSFFRFPHFASRKEWEQHAAVLRRRMLIGSGLLPLPASMCGGVGDAFDYNVFERTARRFFRRTVSDLRASTERELLAERMRNAVRASVQVSDEELWREYQRTHDQMAVKYLRFNLAFYRNLVRDDDPEQVANWAVAHEADISTQWLRRRDAGFDEQLRTYLFTDRPLLAVEEASDGGDAADTTPDAPSSPAGLSGLGIGGLKGTDSL